MGTWSRAVESQLGPWSDLRGQALPELGVGAKDIFGDHKNALQRYRAMIISMAQNIYEPWTFTPSTPHLDGPDLVHSYECRLWLHPAICC